jgi:membrane-associated protein
VLDFFMQIDQSVIGLLTQYHEWIYLILFLIVFCETGLVIFPFLPGDSLLFAAGTMAAGAAAAAGEGPATASVHMVLIVLIAAAMAGNSTNYWTGRYIGKRVFKWEDSRFFNKKNFNRAHRFYQKHGGKTIILARWIPFVRTFAPFVAGVAQMDYRRFIVMDAIGAVTWVVSLVMAGYLFGKALEDYVGLIIGVMLLLSLVPILAVIVRGRQIASAMDDGEDVSSPQVDPAPK